MLKIKQLFSITTIFFIFISGCVSPNVVDTTQIATLSVMTETPKPISSQTTIPSETVTPRLTPVHLNARESLELAQEISPEATSITLGDDEYAYAFNKDGGFVGFYNPKTKMWEDIPAAAKELDSLNSEPRLSSGGVVSYHAVIISTHEKGLVGSGAERIPNPITKKDSNAFVIRSIVISLRGSDGILRLIEVPDISTYSNGIALRGHVVSPNMPQGFSLEQVEISLQEWDYNTYQNPSEEGYTAPGNIYWTNPNDPNVVTINPSTGDEILISLPEKDNYPSDAHRKQVMEALLIDIPEIIGPLKSLAETGDLTAFPGFEEAEIIFVPILGRRIVKDVKVK